MPDDNPAIVVTAYNRPHGLTRLLSSLSRADFSGSKKVPLVLSIDGGDSREVCRLARSFNWPFGEKRIIERKENLGWRAHAMECGGLTEQYGSIVFLGDDLYVSPHFHEFAIQALNFYAEDEAIAGISLFSLLVNEDCPIGLPFYPIDDGYDVFFVQRASLLGWVVTWKQWKLFREWYSSPSSEITAQEALPSSVLSWPKTSLSKYFVKYLLDRQRYVVYPRTSTCTNFGDPGTHLESASRVFQVPLEISRRHWRFISVRDSVSVYDVFHELVPDRLNALCKHFHGFDYVVDLYGSRDLTKVDTGWVLTTRQPLRYQRAFGKDLVPLEMNVIEDVQGEGVWFCEKDALPAAEEREEVRLRNISYFFPTMPPNNGHVAEIAKLRSACVEKELVITGLVEQRTQADKQLELVRQQRDSARQQLQSVRGSMKALARATINAIGKRLGRSGL